VLKHQYTMYFIYRPESHKSCLWGD